MSYMVQYTGLDGSVAFGRCEELSDAVTEVERLRNEQSIEGAQIYRLEEVKFEIKPYFRVELPVPAAATVEFASVLAATDAPTEAVGPGEDALWTTVSARTVAEVPSMIAPPPPPPPPAPVAPMAFAAAPMDEDDDAVVGSRRGLFGR